MSDDLITWLRAQLDEDERVALDAQRAECDVFDGTGVVVMHAATGTRSVTLTSTVATHIARHDPARVLAEVEAKWLLLGLHRNCNESCYVVRLLALPYADQDGFREEWRP